eukprot:1908440-Rhodomonas_salina.2
MLQPMYTPTTSPFRGALVGYHDVQPSVLVPTYTGLPIRRVRPVMLPSTHHSAFPPHLSHQPAHANQSLSSSSYPPLPYLAISAQP